MTEPDDNNNYNDTSPGPEHTSDPSYGVLIEIRNELRGIRGDLARVDERTQAMEDRLSAVEDTSDKNTRTANRNKVIIGGGLTLFLTILSIAVSWGFGLI